MATRTTAVEMDDVYELPSVENISAIPDVWQNPATYTLEMAVRCPHCEEMIHTMLVENPCKIFAAQTAY